MGTSREFILQKNRYEKNSTFEEEKYEKILNKEMVNLIVEEFIIQLKFQNILKTFQLKNSLLENHFFPFLWKQRDIKKYFDNLLKDRNVLKYDEEKF